MQKKLTREYLSFPNSSTCQLFALYYLQYVLKPVNTSQPLVAYHPDTAGARCVRTEHRQPVICAVNVKTCDQQHLHKYR